MDAKYIAMDIETGGIGLDKSLLEVYLVVLDENLKPIHTPTEASELHMLVKPKDKIYHCTAEALGINKINLVEHDKEANKPDFWSSKLYGFLNSHTCCGKYKLIPIGHGIKFDIHFILNCKDKLMNKGTWDNFVSYRYVDTSSICQFLKDSNRLPDSLSGSLESLADNFNLSTQGLHTAKTDTWLAIEVYQKFLDLIE